MQIRKNTKAFKTIVTIIEACRERPDRTELVRLFITKAGQSVKDRINIQGIETNSDLFYELNYQAIVNNIQSAGYQLHVSDELPGVYFLRGSNKTWDETPFEFAEIILKKFSGLPELPAVRKKESYEKYSLPTAKEQSTPSTTGKKKKEKTIVEKAKPIAPAPKQPTFRLKQTIEFTHLDRLIYTQANLNKKGVLDYYDKIADYLLPWLKDRALWVRSQSSTPTEFVSLDKNLWASDSSITLPTWMQQRPISKETQSLLCNDREHLFFYLEHELLEFSSAHSRLKSITAPDYMVFAIDSSELSKTIDTTLATHEILKGLQLPSFVKTDGQNGFHIYISLDGKSEFEKCSASAEFISKLIRLKIPDLITLNETDEMTYGKVVLNYSLNAINKSITAPYSLVQGSLPTVATPLRWDEIQHDLRIEDFNIHTIFKRLNQTGDPFESFFKKKVNADELLARLEENYSFLI